MIWDFIRNISLKDVLAAVAVILIFSNVLEKIFGITVIGKKIYKGAPALWKWVMRYSTERKDIQAKLDQIELEIGELKKEFVCEDGVQIRHVVKTIKNTLDVFKDILKSLDQKINLSAMRLDLNDIVSEEMVFRMDEKGACTFINEAFLEKFGYTMQDIEGYNWETVIHKEDQADVKTQWERAIAKCSRYNNDQRIMTREGAALWVRMYGYPILDSKQLKGFYGTIDLLPDKK